MLVIRYVNNFIFLPNIISYYLLNSILCKRLVDFFSWDYNPKFYLMNYWFMIHLIFDQK